MIFFINILYFILFYISCLSFFFLVNYYIQILKKFFIILFCCYDLWRFIDDPYRYNVNNTHYNSNYNYYILDYEYFYIMKDIYYNDFFLDPNLEFIFYMDFISENSTIENEEHELYRFLSIYIIPLHYKYYILEHYWPPDERGGLILYENFYNFNDLFYEFKFINKDFFPLLEIYSKTFNSKMTIINENLLDNNIIQYYYYNSKSKFFKKEILNKSYYEISKNIFFKKEKQIFKVLKPKNKLEKKKYIYWFKLIKEYNLKKFNHFKYINLPNYELFDKKYYDFYLNFNEKNLNTTYFQFIETIDEYFLDVININNLLNYYFENEFLINKINNLLELSIFDQNFLFLYINFFHRIIISIFYIISLKFFLVLFFYFITCWFSLNYFNYSFDFDLHLNYIRLLTRYNYLNNYQDYKNLIFNNYFLISDIHENFFFQNNKLILNSKCKRDKLIFPDKFHF